MAYINQEEKAELAPAIKAVCNKYGIKASIAIRHRSTLVVNIKSGVVDLIGNFNEVSDTRSCYGDTLQHVAGHLSVNQYWHHEHFSGIAKAFFEELYVAMRGDRWFDRSDIQSDYFNTAYYMDVNVGQWDKHYTLTAK